LKRLIWSQRARRELFDIAECYLQHDAVLAMEMLARSEKGSRELLEFPYLGALTTGGARKWRACRTPFVLLDDVRADAIEVVSVRHARSDWPR
jgi:plasmid stabilization system protein ParE